MFRQLKKTNKIEGNMFAKHVSFFCFAIIFEPDYEPNAGQIRSGQVRSPCVAVVGAAVVAVVVA